MWLPEVLRSINLEQLDYIQQKVEVFYDDTRQIPLGFVFAGKTFPVHNVLCRCKITENNSGYAYLVEIADNNIFYLYNHRELYKGRDLADHDFWVLCFRILHDNELMRMFLEDRKMLGNITLKRVVDFHGHICPELVIGSKFCEYIQHLIAEKVLDGDGFSILAENSTSALDAIQVLLGITVGNQRLLIMDYGKHNYTLYSRNQDQAWSFRMISLSFGDEESFHQLENKIISNNASLEDIATFQRLIDTRVQRIFSLTPEELFVVESTERLRQPGESTSTYSICSMCGEQVLSSRCVERCNKVLCLPCFQKEAPGCMHYGMQ